MNAGIPEHVYVNQGVGIKLDVSNSFSMERIYKLIRDRDTYLKGNKEWINPSPVCYAIWKSDMESGCIIKVYIIEKENSTRMEVAVEINHHVSEGFDIPILIHYPIAYAVTSKYEGEFDTYIIIAFYDDRDNVVIELKQVDGWRVRSKASRFALVRSQVKSKNEKPFDGGCLYCDKAVYEKDGGIIYLRCTKYVGRVKETEYAGTEYPEYCKRR